MLQVCVRKHALINPAARGLSGKLALASLRALFALYLKPLRKLIKSLRCRLDGLQIGLQTHCQRHTLKKHTHTHQSAERQASCLFVLAGSCSAMLAIRVGRDNYNCCIKSSDKQLICSGQQEF